MGTTLRVAVIADTHLPRGNRQLPKRCVEEILRADLLLHAGDVTSVDVFESLEELGTPLRAVRGNVDCSELRRRLPEKLSLPLEALMVGLIHDAGPAKGRLRRLRRLFPDAAAVIFGHSHMPLHEREAGFQIFNPGSPTERRRAPARAMGVAEVEGGRIRLRHIALEPGLALS